MRALQTLLAAGLLEVTMAIPQGLGAYDPTGRCRNHHLDKFDNVKVNPDFFEEWQMASGITCASNNDAPCTLSKTFTVVKTTAFTLGLQIQAKMKVTQIWEVAPTVTFGYTWATSKGTSTSSSQPCARGDGIYCGLMYRTKMVKVSGTYYRIEDPMYGSCSKARQDQQPFEILSAVVIGDKSSEVGDEAYVEYEACITRCEGDAACWKAHQSGTVFCPGMTPPPNWGKNPDEGKPPAPTTTPSPNPDQPGGGGAGKPGCDVSPGNGAQVGQCAPELIGSWNCVKGESYQRCSSGTWSGLTPLPAGTFCDCGFKGRDWDPANPATNPPVRIGGLMVPVRIGTNPIRLEGSVYNAAQEG